MVMTLRETSEAEWSLPHVFLFESQSVRFGVIGEGPPAVLVHGTPFSSVVWRRIAPYLLPSRQVFYYDLLGYGLSEMRDAQDVSLGIQNRLLAALLGYWKLDRPDVVAHDFGGATALRTHLLDAGEYRSLMLIDPVAIAPWGSPFVQHVRMHEDAFSGLPPSIHAAIVAEYVAGAVHRPMSRKDLRRYVEPWLTLSGSKGFYRQIAQMHQRYTDEIEDRLAEIRCPVSILWGEEDRWIPIERGRSLASRIPNSRFRAVSGAGHLVQEDAPEAVVAELLRFLPSIR
jgi:pimeloyl-ACP methyl ester carboxylesterase